MTLQARLRLSPVVKQGVWCSTSSTFRHRARATMRSQRANARMHRTPHASPGRSSSADRSAQGQRTQGSTRRTGNADMPSARKGQFRSMSKVQAAAYSTARWVRCSWSQLRQKWAIRPNQRFSLMLRHCRRLRRDQTQTAWRAACHHSSRRHRNRHNWMHRVLSVTRPNRLDHNARGGRQISAICPQTRLYARSPGATRTGIRPAGSAAPAAAR